MVCCRRLKAENITELELMQDRVEVILLLANQNAPQNFRRIVELNGCELKAFKIRAENLLYKVDIKEQSSLKFSDKP